MNSHIAINLASPEPFKKKTQVKTEPENDSVAKKDSAEPTAMEIDEETENISSPQSVPEELSKPVESSVGVKREAESEASAKPPPGPKRKKVLKTRINERGKEGNGTRNHVADYFFVVIVMTFYVNCGF